MSAKRLFLVFVSAVTIGSLAPSPAVACLNCPAVQGSSECSYLFFYGYISCDVVIQIPVSGPGFLVCQIQGGCDEYGPPAPGQKEPPLPGMIWTRLAPTLTERVTTVMGSRCRDGRGMTSLPTLGLQLLGSATPSPREKEGHGG
jgi:hypothetical protein